MQLSINTTRTVEAHFEGGGCCPTTVKINSANYTQLSFSGYSAVSQAVTHPQASGIIPKGFMPFAFSSESHENDTLDLENDISFNPFTSLSADTETIADWRDNGHSTSHTDSELTHHPLRSSNSGKGNSTRNLDDDNAGITRPHLTRILHAFNGSASSTPPDDDTTTPTTPPLEQDERLVQVHQVIYGRPSYLSDSNTTTR